MMCSEADRWISMRVDGEPFPQEAASRLDTHLRDCTACRSLLAEDARRCSMLALVLGEGREDEGRLAARIIQAACAGSKRRNLHLFPFLRVVSSLAAVLLVGIALRFVLTGPASGPTAPLPERFWPTVMEQDSWRPDGVDYRDGKPLERRVRTQKWIYGFPGREPCGTGLYLEGERVDTLYQPVTWMYH